MNIPILGQPAQPSPAAPTSSQLRIAAQWIPQQGKVAIQFGVEPTAYVIRLNPDEAAQFVSLCHQTIQPEIDKAHGRGLLVAEAQIPPGALNGKGT